jgi:hypothetical protein
MRAKNVVESNDREKITDPDLQVLVTTMRSFREGVLGVNQPLERALYIFENGGQSKLLMESLLIAPDSSVEKIANSLNADHEMVRSYRKYLFNPEMFIDNFCVVEFIANIECEQDKVTKVMALTQGYNFVLSHFTGGKLNFSSQEIAHKMQDHALYMVLQSRGHAVNSDVAKEAKAWIPAVKSNMDYLSKASEQQNAQADFLADFNILFEKDEEIKSIGTIEGEVARG